MKATVTGGYLICAVRESVDDADYDAIVMAYRSKPADEEGYVYKLRYPELEWEKVEEEPEEEATSDEILDILLGGDSE